jgi:hypothetical protein
MAVKLIVEFGDKPLKIEMVPPPEPVGCVVTASIDGFSVTARGNHMVYKLPDDKDLKVSVQYVDKKGHPAEIDGEVTWTTSDEMIVNVGVQSGDSTKALIHPGANLGQAQITATADADLGEGVTEVICTFDVEIVAGTAVSGTITPEGEPVPQATSSKRK